MIMDKPLSAAHRKSAIADTCAEMARAIEQMRKDQAEIDRLQAETRAMLKQLEAA